VEQLLVIFVLIPLAGFLVNVCVPGTNEKLMARVAFSTMALQFVAALVFTIFWIYNHGYILYTKEITIYRSEGIELFADFCFDKITAGYLMVGASLSFLITAFSRTYLHREGGFKRFFNTILFFYLGYNILVLSGNLATFFIGWEVAGISSFLLIGYYRNRYIPIRNAVKIFAIYRIADLAFILGIWASHHIWHKNIVLLEFENTALVMEHIKSHPNLSIFFSVMILLAASIKSAQLPFSSWLPRAMEGPTPSSAIFYSSLSVHAGLLLLLRTEHFWQHLPVVKFAIAGLGFLTFVVAGTTARVQSNIKAQIAYSSIAQIGLMFIEAAFDLQWLVLIHFAGNAFLRSYQLLISPSIVTYQIREQFYNFVPVKKLSSRGFIQKIKNSIFVLCVEEWFMDEFMHHSIWNFLKIIGKKLRFITIKVAVISSLVLLVPCIYLLVNRAGLSSGMRHYVPPALSLIGVLFALRSFAEKKSVYLSWFLVVFNHLLTALAVIVFAPVHWEHVLFYIGGIVLSATVGVLCLKRLSNIGIDLNLNWYQGHCYEHPKINFAFFLASLGLIGFPITTAFLGIELFMGYIHADQLALIFLVSLGLLVNSLSLIRIYSRIFLGPHVKTYHEVARKSS
jgi:NADH-quinone oxidoreductase subunit L